MPVKAVRTNLQGEERTKFERLMRHRRQTDSGFHMTWLEVGEAATSYGYKLNIKHHAPVSYRGHGRWHIHTTDGLRYATTGNSGRILMTDKNDKGLGVDAWFIVEETPREKALYTLADLYSKVYEASDYFLAQYRKPSGPEGDDVHYDEYRVPFDAARYEGAVTVLVESAKLLLPNYNWSATLPTLDEVLEVIPQNLARLMAQRRFEAENF